VEQHDVEVVGVGLAAEVVEALLGIAVGVGSDLGHEAVGVAGDAAQGDAEHAMHFGVGFGGFEEADAAVVGVTDQGVELVLAEVALDCSVVGSGAEGEARDFDVRLAQGDPVGGFGAVGQQRQGAGGGERAGGEGGADEFAAGSAGMGGLRGGGACW